VVEQCESHCQELDQGKLKYSYTETQKHRNTETQKHRNTQCINILIHRHRHIHRHTHIHTHTLTQKHRNTQMHKHKHTHSQTHTHTLTHKQKHRNKDDDERADSEIIVWGSNNHIHTLKQTLKTETHIHRPTQTHT
jgi:hypothetical protein